MTENANLQKMYEKNTFFSEASYPASQPGKRGVDLSMLQSVARHAPVGKRSEPNYNKLYNHTANNSIKKLF